MKGLRSLIQSYLFAYGGPGKPLAALADDLDTRMRRNEKYIIACALMLVTLFIVTLGLVIACRDRPGMLAAITGAIGVPVIACITAMRELWREKGAMDVLIVMVRHLPAGEAKIALQQYVNRLSRREDLSPSKDRNLRDAEPTMIKTKKRSPSR